MARQLHWSALAFRVAAVAAMALLIFISESSYYQSRAAMQELDDVYAAHASVQRMMLQITQAETGERGFLLTGRDEYLEPFREAVKGIPATLALLKRHYDRNERLGREMAEIQDSVLGKLSEMGETIRLYRSGQKDHGRELLLTNIGKEQMDSVRETAERMLHQEALDSGRARKAIDDALMIDRVGIAAMAVLSVLAVLLYLRQRGAMESQRRAHLESARDELQARVEERTRDLAELARHLQTAREDERQRLARELHDELGSLLTAAKLDAARIKTRLANTSPEGLERLAHLNEILNSVIALKRRILEDLRPSSLSNLGLVATLEILARDFAERADIQIDCELQAVELDPDSELTVFRLVQEALTNIAKYARARRVRIALSRRDGMALISVTDDGVGFDPVQPRIGSHGLLGMRYRVEGDGGRLEVSSVVGCGSQLQATLPLRQAPTAQALVEPV